MLSGINVPGKVDNVENPFWRTLQSQKTKIFPRNTSQEEYSESQKTLAMPEHSPALFHSPML